MRNWSSELSRQEDSGANKVSYCKQKLYISDLYRLFLSVAASPSLALSGSPPCRCHLGLHSNPLLLSMALIE